MGETQTFMTLLLIGTQLTILPSSAEQEDNQIQLLLFRQGS